MTKELCKFHKGRTTTTTTTTNSWNGSNCVQKDTTREMLLHSEDAEQRENGRTVYSFDRVVQTPSPPSTYTLNDEEEKEGENNYARTEPTERTERTKYEIRNQSFLWDPRAKRKRKKELETAEERREPEGREIHR